MNSLSLKWRLGISVTIMVIIIIAVLSVTAFVQFSETLKKGIDNALLSQADAVIASITSDDSLMEGAERFSFTPADIKMSASNEVISGGGDTGLLRCARNDK